MRICRLFYMADPSGNLSLCSVALIFVPFGPSLGSLILFSDFPPWPPLSSLAGGRPARRDFLSPIQSQLLFPYWAVFPLYFFLFLYSPLPPSLDFLLRLSPKSSSISKLQNPLPISLPICQALPILSLTFFSKYPHPQPVHFPVLILRPFRNFIFSKLSFGPLLLSEFWLRVFPLFRAD